MRTLHFSHWVRSANFTQAAEISMLSSRAGFEEAQAWGAASAMKLLPTDLIRMLKTLAAVDELNVGGASTPARDLQQAVTLLRELALEHAQTHQQAGSINATRDAELFSPPWSNERINASVDVLAARYGISAPAAVAVMKSCLSDPGLTRDQRATTLGLSPAVVINNTNRIRTTLGIGSSENLRIGLAKQVGMPLSDVVARIRAPGDAGLTRRVMNTINASHREGVAERLLTVQLGTDADVTVYEALDAIFRGGDPFAASAALGKQLDLPKAKFTSSDNFLRRTFPGNRIAMLRTMGFNHEQIMSMNPVGAEIAKRFDPALGSYSAEEKAVRREKNLPCTREEASERLLRVGAGNVDKIRSMSYRSWLTLGLVSDNPSAMPSDISRAFQSVAPDASDRSGVGEMNTNFRIAQVLLGREIPRGARLELQDRTYRAEINLLLLQTFGLGATRIGTGRLDPIATDFKVTDWPSPVDAPEGGGRRAPRSESSGREATWQELLPLLQRRTFGAN
jgi:hypothetical protein